MESIAILTGGGPAPGMNTVVGSVAKTFLQKGFRVIGLHGGYSGLFNKNPKTTDIDFLMADDIFNRGGSYLTMSRFKPTDKNFEEDFNLDFFVKNNVKLLVTVGGDDTASTANRIAKFLEEKKYPIANIHVPKTIDQRPAAAGRFADLRLPVCEGHGLDYRPHRCHGCQDQRKLVRRGGYGPFGRTPGVRYRYCVPLSDDS